MFDSAASSLLRDSSDRLVAAHKGQGILSVWVCVGHIKDYNFTEMDEITDKKGTERSLQYFSRLVDARKLQTEAFGENKMGERAYRRAERIVLALTLVTNHLAEEEILRKRVRRLSVLLLEDILDARSEMRSFGSQTLQTVRARIRQIISMVRVLSVAGSISLQNAEILIEALDELGSFVTISQRSALSDTVQLSRKDLLDVQSEEVLVKDITDNNLVKDNSVVKKTVLYKTTRNDSRSAGIVESLKGSSALSIREIAVNFPEYSEKMIQRELADLVVRGIVKKIGFKRWSKYAISSSEQAPSL